MPKPICPVYYHDSSASEPALKKKKQRKKTGSLCALIRHSFWGLFVINCGQLKTRAGSWRCEEQGSKRWIATDLQHVTQSLALIIRLSCCGCLLGLVWLGRVESGWVGLVPLVSARLGPLCLFKSRFQVQTMAALIDATHQAGRAE